MKKIRFAIVGLGIQGKLYNDLIQQGKIADCEVTAYCDNDKSRIDFIKKVSTFNDAVYFTDYDEMLKSNLFDAVLIQTPHFSHPEMVKKALSYGYGVVCDKPAGICAEQVQDMIDYSKTVSAPFTMMFNQRTNCVYRKIREMVQGGAIGKLQRVNWVITDWYRTQLYYNSAPWRATWQAEGGGVLITQCLHQLDLLYWIVGKLPSIVRGFCQYGKWHDIEVEDEVTAYFEYADGATGVFITSTGETPGANRLEISGTGGKLLCEHDKLFFYENKVDAMVQSRKGPHGFARPEFTVTEVVTDGKNEQHAGILNNFVGYMLGREELFVDGEEGLYSIEFMNAIEYSGWTGETVTVPVDAKLYAKTLRQKIRNSNKKPNL